MKASKDNYNNVYNSIAIIVDKIIRNIKKEKEMVSILGRSAGGGIYIFLYKLIKEKGEYIDGLNLVAPGYDSRGLDTLFLDKIKKLDLPIRLSRSSKDIKVSGEEIYRMDSKIRKVSLSNYQFIEVCNTDNNIDNPDHDGINHRILKEALEILV